MVFTPYFNVEDGMRSLSFKIGTFLKSFDGHERMYDGGVTAKIQGEL